MAAANYGTCLSATMTNCVARLAVCQLSYTLVISYSYAPLVRPYLSLLTCEITRSGA